MSITASAYWAFFKYSFSLSRAFCKFGSIIYLKSMTLRHEGYYHSAIYHGPRGEIQIADVVKITAGIFAIKISPIWTHGDKNDYTAYAHFHPKYSEFIIGRWAHNITEKRFGSFVFKINDSNGSKKIFGKYIGVSTSNNIQSSAWLLERTSTFKQYNYYNFFNKLKRRFVKPKNVKKDIFESIIAKHKGYFADINRTPFEYEGLQFSIPENGFNPKYGKISKPLLEHLISNEQNLSSKSVLDVGTGCGFYAVVLGHLEHLR